MLPAFSIGTLWVPTFPLLVLLALAVGATLGTRQARYVGVDADAVWRMIPWAAIAGVAGSKLYYLLGIARHVGADPIAAIRGSGMVWYGGAIAGVAVAAWRIRRTTATPPEMLFDYGAPCLAAGHAIGRIGCFLAGDDWGVPTRLPWAVAFPHGAPPSTAGNLRGFGVAIPADVPNAAVLAVHPTQLYEAAGLALLAWWLWRASRRAHRPWTVLARYLVGYGALRFAVECLRAKDDHLPIGLTAAQAISLVLVAVGALLLFRPAPRSAPAVA